jgi:lactate permease
MLYFLAVLPILVVLGLMVWLRWGGQRVGPIGWFGGLVVGFTAFGLTPQALLVSQLKGLYLSFTVLLIIWPAMFLYHLVDQIGGIQATAHSLRKLVGDQGLLIVMLAWSFAGMLEGLAGFGLPIAVVSPMLVGLGVSPMIAVAATAVGHSWSVTFGDMGVIYQTLISITRVDGAALAPAAALFLGLACLACGLAAAWILKQGRLWFVIFPLAAVMGGIQY